MITFKQFLIEAREDFIAQQLGTKLTQAFDRDTGRKPTGNPTPIDIVNHLAQAGPKYIQWIANQYVKGSIKFEDIPQVKQDLTQFAHLVTHNIIKNKDINQYKTIGDLRKEMKSKDIGGLSYNTKLEKLYAGLNNVVKSGHGKWIYNNPTDPVKIFVPLDETGSVGIRKACPDIKWCTTIEDDLEALHQYVADIIAEDRVEQAKEEWKGGGRRFRPVEPDWEDAFEAYKEEALKEVKDGMHDDVVAERKENMHDYYIRQYGGDFYVVLTPSGAYQFHFESNQFMDEDDSPVSFAELASQYPTIQSILGPIVKRAGHPHFDIKSGAKLQNKKQVIAALKASLENEQYVDATVLSKENWVDIGTHLMNTKGGQYDSRKQSTSNASYIFYKLNRLMLNINMDHKDIKEVLQAVRENYPKSLSFRLIPINV